jgi:hypothetical protein
MTTATILNTSILTQFGTFTYSQLTLEEARARVAAGFQSAIGHQSTADVISTLLNVEMKMNRQQYSQGVGDVALVFKLKGRPPEGVILSASEIADIGYEWGLLTRTA